MQMTNEQLAEHAAAGDRQALHELWEAVAPLCFMRVRAICNQQDPGKLEARGVTVEDLQQEMYFAFLEAVYAYDSSTGYKFTTYLNFPIRNMCAKTLGYRIKRYDPLDRSISLDVPAGNEVEGDKPFANTIPDLDAEQRIDAVVEKLYQEHAHNILEAAMRKYCTDAQREILRLRYYEGKSPQECADELKLHNNTICDREINALRTLRRCPMWKQLRAMLPDDN